MRWEQFEYVLKGVYLGLLLAIGLQAPTWWQAGLIGLVTLGALAVCLALAALGKLRQGYRVRGRALGFLLYLVLENPVLVYAGVIGGLALGFYFFLFDPEMFDWKTLGPVIGGAVVGLAFRNVRDWQDRRWRFWGNLVLAAALVAAAMLAMNRLPTIVSKDMIAYLLLLGIPGFYLLTFAGVTEESESDIAAICAALGVGLFMLLDNDAYRNALGSPYAHYTVQILPLGLYWYYTRRVLPGLRVFKHVLRGISFAQVGRYRQALTALGRALTLEPRNRLAREQLWHVFQDMDFDQLIQDPETLAVVNFELCLERVAWLLLQSPPKPEQVAEAIRLIDLVDSQRPALVPAGEYWRAVALLHQRDYDGAAQALGHVLVAPEQDSPQRRSVLVPAWQLALLLHPEMIRRVGTSMLGQPGRRMEAIAAVERQLNADPEDQPAWDLKRVLYADLTEADYQGWAGVEQPAAEFDHAYALQLGQALLVDKERWQRGCEYVRIAARGLPLQASTLFVEIARAHERAGEDEPHRNYLYRAMQAGRGAGAPNLAGADRDLLFKAVKWLGDSALAAGNLDEALECLQFYTQYEKAGLETYRALADIYERRAAAKTDPEEHPKDIWLALHCTEHALSYDASDRDLLERKDRYYYSITSDQLKKSWDNVYKWFDVDYCRDKVRKILDRPDANVELLDWASHLADLAQTAQPSSLSARLLQARIERLRGEVGIARALLEEIRTNKPEKFPTSEEEEAWFLANRYLGEMYVDDKPDQAVLCLSEYKQYPKSGAATMFQLARAYENLGDHARALRCYENVAAYEGNPLVWEAEEAMRRLRNPAAAAGGQVPSRGETQ